MFAYDAADDGGFVRGSPLAAAQPFLSLRSGGDRIVVGGGLGRGEIEVDERSEKAVGLARG